MSQTSTDPATSDVRSLRIAKAVTVSFALGALALSIFGVSMLADAFASRKWPAVSGKVQTSRVVRSTSSSSSSPKNRRYYVKLSYSYEVDGETFTSQRYSFGDGARATGNYRDREDADAERRERFLPGREVSVHYDPDDAGNAVLDPALHWSAGIPLLLGSIFLALALWALARIPPTGRPPPTGGTHSARR